MTQRIRLQTLAGAAFLVAGPLAVYLSRSAPRPWALFALGLVLTTLVLTIGALWLRSTESILTIIVVLVLLVPQNYVLVGPLRSAGNPALLGGMFALALWMSGRVLGLVTPERGNPVRWVMMFYVLAACTAFSAGMMRPLTQIESSGASRALFPVAAVVGVALFACDGLRTLEQIDKVVQRLVLVGGLSAVAGILEFVFHGFNYRTTAHFPGLTANTELISDTRSGFQRVMGAAAHPIEYSVVLAALAPLALHLVMNAPTRRARQANFVALAALLVVTPMTVSRSGVVCLVVGLGWYLVHLNGRARLNVVVLGILGLGAMRSAIPGLLGTLRSLLFVGEQDPSIANRTADYAKIPGLLDGHLAFGRGLGTFQPDQYFFLDNQYLGSLVEGGLLGLAVLIALFVVGMGLARGARKRAQAPATRGLGQALSASIAAFAVAGVTFDELSFRQTGIVLFLLIGCSGALWTVVRLQTDTSRSTPAREHHPAGVLVTDKAPLRV